MRDWETLGGVCATVQQRLEREQQVLKEALPIPLVTLSMAPPQSRATPTPSFLSPRIFLSTSTSNFLPAFLPSLSTPVHIRNGSHTPLSLHRMTNSGVSSCSPQKIKASKEHQPETCH